jgi:hypothetical protein
LIGGTNDILNFTGGMKETVQHLKFQRLLQTEDKLDSPFIKGNKTIIVFAYNSETTEYFNI